MKKIYPLLSLLFIAFTACEDRLEDVRPRTAVSPEVVNSAGDIESLLIGAYDGAQSAGTDTDNIGATLYYLSALTEDLSADNLRFRATFFQHGEIDANAILVSNVLVNRYYIGPYLTISRVNDILTLIEEIEESDFSSANRKNEIIGEVHYIRALSYFRLVSLFGGVPVVTTNTLEAVARDTEDRVWQQIIDDLQVAIENAPDFAPTRNMFVSKDAARALRARVALYREDYALAVTLAEEVISNTAFAIATDSAEWRAIYDAPVSSSEIIFQLVTTITEGQSSHGFFLMDNINPFGTSGRLELPVDESLVDAFEDGDFRAAGSFVPTTFRPGFFQAIKYPGGLNGDDNFIISRISEMYLTSAEAAAKRDDNPAAGIDRLNDVRTNRGLAALPTPADMDLFEDAILQERRVELAFEGFRWADLKRTDRAISVLPNVNDVNQLLYPIPQQARDRNPLLIQNDGY